MKGKTIFGALLVSVALCGQGFGFELLDRMLGLNTGGCGQPTCCQPAGQCCEQPACCAPARCEPACCDPACSTCCAPKCDLFAGLKGLFACGGCCQPACGTCTPVQ